jgi:GTP cyclohydrolase-4
MTEDPGCRVRRDTQQERPAVSVALSRAGVTNLRRIISIKDGGKAELFYATLDLFADLSPEQAGVHM